MQRKGLKGIVKDIRELRIQGASSVRNAAVKAIKASVQESKAKTMSELREELRENLLLVLNARPTEPGLRTAIRVISKKALERVDALDDLKWNITNLCKNYNKDRKKALETIGKYGARTIKKNSVVFTHCHSHTVEEILTQAKKKVDAVYCTETRPLFQGRITAKRLSGKGIPVTMVVDSAASVFLREADYFFTGCDAILSDGSVINKIGTRQVSIAAQKEDTPHFVAGSTHKFNPMSFYGETEAVEQRPPKEVWESPPKGTTILNPAFDRTEAEYLEGIVTEKGIFDPHTFSLLMYRELRLNKRKQEYLNIIDLLKELK